jgi:hypothetical protein
MDPVAVRGIERLIVVANTPILLLIGYRLFVLGVTGQMKLTTKVDKWSATFVNLTPGGFCFLLSVALAGYILFNKVPVAIPGPPANSESRPLTEPAVEPQNLSSDGESPKPAKDRSGKSGPAAAPVPVFYYLGETHAVPLSILLRKGLSDLWLCQHTPGADEDRCMDTFSSKFRTGVTAQDLTTIEKLEKDSAQGNPQAVEALTNMRRNFIK